MKFLIAGLGNPGEQYRDTRHNIGFNILDALAGASSSFFTEDRHVQLAEVKHKGRTLVLIKPQTFMNLSGKAVNYWMQKEKIPIQRLLVVTDDIALPFGEIRLRGKGSDGGHNGLKDIIATLNTPNFARLRFGVGSDFPKGKQADYVLSPWTLEQNQDLPDRIKKATEVILSFSTLGPEKTMSLFNGK